MYRAALEHVLWPRIGELERAIAAGTAHTRGLGWLRGQGYPLEMVVAGTFKDAGFDVTQSEYYEELETHKFREIDVAARWMERVKAQIDAPGGLLICLSVLIECKASADKPWVLFASSTKPLADARARPSTETGNLLIKGFRDLWDGTLLEHEIRWPAYGVTQAFTTGSDAAYTACHAAVKPATAEVTFPDSKLAALRYVATINPDRRNSRSSVSGAFGI
jgi:hypothetical protein